MTDVHVGLVGPDADAATVVVEDAGGRASAGTAADVLAADVDAVAALSERALYDLVRAGVTADTPLLPVSGPGFDAERDDALAALAGGDYATRPRPTLAVAARHHDYRAFADVTLVSAEAARISEYTVDVAGETGVERVDSVRADGVVVATPTGTRGYVARADGPQLSAAVDAVAVVPIAPFRVECPDWVVSLPATITVARDETDVSLLVDDRDVGPVDPGDPVDVSYGDPVALARPD
ncbi:MAG: hypothetical protein ABEJ80_04625 [Halarchaeum sp.]